MNPLKWCAALLVLCACRFSLAQSSDPPVILTEKTVRDYARLRAGAASPDAALQNARRASFDASTAAYIEQLIERISAERRSAAIAKSDEQGVAMLRLMAGELGNNPEGGKPGATTKPAEDPEETPPVIAVDEREVRQTLETLKMMRVEQARIDAAEKDLRNGVPAWIVMMKAQGTAQEQIDAQMKAFEQMQGMQAGIQAGMEAMMPAIQAQMGGVLGEGDGPAREIARQMLAEIEGKSSSTQPTSVGTISVFDEESAEDRNLRLVREHASELGIPEISDIRVESTLMEEFGRRLGQHAKDHPIDEAELERKMKEAMEQAMKANSGNSESRP